MRIAKDQHGTIVQCEGSTDPGGQYLCGICGEKVYPRNELKKEHGRIREYCFAHYSDNCTGSLESYFHWIAKQIIHNSKEITLPLGIYNYDSVLIECTTLHQSIRPDAVLNNELVIEVNYRNPKSHSQIEIFKSINLTTVEIDISTLDIHSSLEEIKYAVLQETTNKHYLHVKDSIKEVNEPSQGPHPLLILGGAVLAFFGLRKLYKSFFGKRKTSTIRRRNRK